MTSRFFLRIRLALLSDVLITRRQMGRKPFLPQNRIPASIQLWFLREFQDRKIDYANFNFPPSPVYSLQDNYLRKVLADEKFHLSKRSFPEIYVLRERICIQLVHAERLVTVSPYVHPRLPKSTLLHANYAGCNRIWANFYCERTTWICIGNASLRKSHNVICNRGKSSLKRPDIVNRRPRNCERHTFGDPALRSDVYQGEATNNQRFITRENSP